MLILKEASLLWRVLLIPYFVDYSSHPVYSLQGKFQLKMKSFCLVHRDKFLMKVCFLGCLQAVYHQSAKHLWSSFKNLGLLLDRSEVRSKTCQNHFLQDFWKKAGQACQIPPHQCLHHLHISSFLSILHYQNHCFEQHLFPY